MRVLVTGSEGFIGRRVCMRLREVGHEVGAFDESRNVNMDIRDSGSLKACAHTADAVVHVAAASDVYQCANNPERAWRTNATGTACVASVCAHFGLPLLYASTWEVYGEAATVHDNLAEHVPPWPDHPYSASKYAGELAVNAERHLRGLRALSLRLGSAYGPGMRQAQVIRKWIDAARAGQPLTVHGDGSQTRQWTHVDDIAEAFRLGLDWLSGKPLPDDPPAVNVVAPEAVSIRVLAETVAARYGVPVTFGEARPGDVLSARVESALAEQVLGWRAQVRFAEGLEALMGEAPPA